MNNSKLILVSVFAFLFLISFASAVTFSDSSKTLSKESGYFLVNVSSSNLNDSVNLSIADITVSGKTIDFSASPSSLTLNNDPQQINVSYIVPSNFNFEFLKDYKTTLTATASNSSDLTLPISFSTSEFCNYENFEGDLKVSIKDVTVSGFGDDNDWYALDKVEVELRIENNGDDDIDDLKIEWGLYDTQNDRWIIEVDEEDEINIKDGDKETITFSFTLDNGLDEDLEDLEEGNYVLYVRATGDVDNTNNDKTCEWDSFDANLILDRDFVILSGLEVPETVQCGSQISLSGDVWNIGSDDQDDVEVKIVSSNLGIEKYVPIGDIDSLTSEDFNFNLVIPEGAEAGTYFLKISVIDEDGDVYENDNDDLSTHEYKITISGDCGSTAKVAVSAVLQSGGQAGKPLIVKATIVNSGTKSATYLLNAASYTSWANSAQLSQSTVVLNAGESAEVLITLDTKKEIEGEQLFNLEVLSNGKLVANQPVSVDIQKKSGLGITGFSINQDNWHLWGIGVLNLILVIIIIIIAVRITKRK